MYILCIFLWKIELNNYLHIFCRIWTQDFTIKMETLHLFIMLVTISLSLAYLLLVWVVLNQGSGTRKKVPETRYQGQAVTRGTHHVPGGIWQIYTYTFVCHTFRRRMHSLTTCMCMIYICVSGKCTQARPVKICC